MSFDAHAFDLFADGFDLMSFGCGSEPGAGGRNRLDWGLGMVIVDGVDGGIGMVRLDLNRDGGQVRVGLDGMLIE